MNGADKLRLLEELPMFEPRPKRTVKAPKTPEEHVQDAERLAKKNGGILPRTGWLKKSGYSALDANMRKRPELFAHISQKNDRGKTAEEWVPFVEKLAEEHDGVLPSSYWLKKNVCSGLSFCMRKRPELFAHILQDRKGKTPEEYVKIAEKLAKEHDGVLPSLIWPDGNHRALYGCIRRHPEVFAHIPRMVRGKVVTP